MLNDYHTFLALTKTVQGMSVTVLILHLLFVSSQGDRTVPP